MAQVCSAPMATDSTSARPGSRVKPVELLHATVPSTSVAQHRDSLEATCFAGAGIFRRRKGLKPKEDSRTEPSSPTAHLAPEPRCATCDAITVGRISLLSG